LLSFLPTRKTETSPDLFTKTTELASMNVLSTHPSRHAKAEMSKDSTRKPEQERSKTSLESLTHMNLLKTQNWMLEQTSSPLTRPATLL